MPFSDNKKINSAFFHFLSKTQTEITQNPYESIFKSGHSIYSKDVFAEEIPYANTEIQADINVTNNPQLLKKYTQITLTAVPGSNSQSWYLNDGGAYIRPFILPTDVLDTSGNPSYGYELKLYKQDGTRIFPTQGNWNIDSYSGLILFEPGYTPSDLGYGNIKATLYVCVGQTLKEALAGIVGGTTFQNPVISKNYNDPSLLSPLNDDRYIVGSENFNIVGINQGLKTFKIEGDHTTKFTNIKKFKVKDSSGNDGYYTVNSSTFDGTYTNIIVIENILSFIVSGFIAYAEGIWNNQIDNIATYKDGNWTYKQTLKGFVTFVGDINLLHNYNGTSWVNIGSGSTAQTTTTNTIDFNYLLSSNEDNVQKALNILDKTLFRLYKPNLITSNTNINSFGVYLIDTTISNIIITLDDILDVNHSNLPVMIKNDIGNNKVILTSNQDINHSSNNYELLPGESVGLISYYDEILLIGEWFVFYSNKNSETNREVLNISDLTLTYFLSKTPFKNDSLNIYYNGLRLNDGFTLIGNQITLDESILGFTVEDGDKLLVEYT